MTPKLFEREIRFQKNSLFSWLIIKVKRRELRGGFVLKQCWLSKFIGCCWTPRDIKPHHRKKNRRRTKKNDAECHFESPVVSPLASIAPTMNVINVESASAASFTPSPSAFPASVNGKVAKPIRPAAEIVANTERRPLSAFVSAA
jgi:hypothetical protein